MLLSQPEPTKPEDLNFKRNQGYFLVTVYDMPAVRQRMEYANAPVEVNITVPRYLVEWAKKKGIDLNEAFCDCLRDKQFELEA